MNEIRSAKIFNRSQRFLTISLLALSPISPFFLFETSYLFNSILSIKLEEKRGVGERERGKELIRQLCNFN